MVANATTISPALAFYQRGMQTVPLKATLGALTVLLNGLVIVVFARLNRTFSNLLFISLSLSDLLIGLIIIPLYIVNTTIIVWPFGDSGQLPAVITCLFYLIIQITQWLPSGYSILMLAAHRFHQLYWPTSVSEKMTKIKTALLVAIWLVPYAVNTIRYIVYYNLGYVNVPACNAYVPLVQFVLYSGLTSVLPVLLSLLLNLANIIGLVRKGLRKRRIHRGSAVGATSTAARSVMVDDGGGSWLRKASRIGVDATSGIGRSTAAAKMLQQQSSRRLRRDIKATVCIGAIIVSSLVTQYPFTLLWPIEALCGWCVAEAIFDASFYILLASPVLNPLVLFVFHDVFQEKLFRLGKRILSIWAPPEEA